ncbi:MAG TPA: hypothetical protein VD769_04860 [Gaiellaceae bacterium]|nr:hypothetical protein [Gaiellaceae bacterium]
MTREQAAALEAVLDERIGLGPDELDPEVRASLDELALLDPARRSAAERALAAAVGARRFTWGPVELTHGELLAAFARHCAEDLDEVEVEESTSTLLVARWRRETSRVELRAGAAGLARLASATPTLLVTDLGDTVEAVVEEFLADAELRARVLVFDPDRLEKIGAVRSSVFVYFEWFLRDSYGVKVLPASGFTQGLIDRGIIHLGMG